MPPGSDPVPNQVYALIVALLAKGVYGKLEHVARPGPHATLVNGREVDVVHCLIGAPLLGRGFAHHDGAVLMAGIPQVVRHVVVAYDVVPSETDVPLAAVGDGVAA